MQKATRAVALGACPQMVTVVLGASQGRRGSGVEHPELCLCWSGFESQFLYSYWFNPGVFP